MNVWIFLFFFVIAAGLVVLFVVGTSCGVSQQITNEDACDPYAPKEKKARSSANLASVKEKRFGRALRNDDVFGYGFGTR